jgi:hypothetical protein
MSVMQAVRLASLAVLVLLAGCLTSTYRVPSDDLERIAHTPPAARGQHVRVIQQLAGMDEAPRGPEVHVHTAVVVDPMPAYGYGGGGGSLGGPRPGGGWGPSAKLAKDDAKALLVVAAIVAVAFATTEGARYDGWVNVHPMQRLHLYGPAGEYMQVPLAQLAPEHAAWASRAYLRSDEGPWTFAGRAPLDRVGFNYNVFFGSSTITSFNEDTQPGYGGRFQLGFFPIQQLGILFDWGAYWRNNEQDLQVYDGRYGVELQLYPITLGRLSLGGFGQIGFATRIEDHYPMNGDDRGMSTEVGGLLQLEITTRLALTGRGGYVYSIGQGGFEAAVGLSIY